MVRPSRASKVGPKAGPLGITIAGTRPSAARARSRASSSSSGWSANRRSQNALRAKVSVSIASTVTSSVCPLTVPYR